MITKGKTVTFYTWNHQGQKYTVIGERTAAKCDGFRFSVYIGKEKQEDEDGQLVLSFIKELKQK